MRLLPKPPVQVAVPHKILYRLGKAVMSKREGKTIKHIREAVLQGKLQEPFSPNDVNTALGIHWAGNFLPKHRVGNPGGDTELFVQINDRPALYCLKDQAVSFS